MGGMVVEPAVPGPEEEVPESYLWWLRWYDGGSGFTASTAALGYFPLCVRGGTLVIGSDKFAETECFGSKAKDEAFTSQFIGKKPPIALSDIDAISGATITSEEIREALAEPLEAILDAVQRTLDHVSPDLAADLVDQGMVLCGGGSLLRRLDGFLAERTGLPVRVAPDSMRAVAKGALVAVEQFQQWRTMMESSDDDE